MLAQVPCCTNFQELPWKATVDVPWHVVPGPGAQSFCDFSATPKHFSLPAATAALASLLACVRQIIAARNLRYGGVNCRDWRLTLGRCSVAIGGKADMSEAGLRSSTALVFRWPMSPPCAYGARERCASWSSVAAGRLPAFRHFWQTSRPTR